MIDGLVAREKMDMVNNTLKDFHIYMLSWPFARGIILFKSTWNSLWRLVLALFFSHAVLDIENI